jgi:hypothetical protein
VEEKSRLRDSREGIHDGKSANFGITERTEGNQIQEGVDSNLKYYEKNSLSLLQVLPLPETRLGGSIGAVCSTPSMRHLRLFNAKIPTDAKKAACRAYSVVRV